MGKKILFFIAAILLSMPYDVLNATQKHAPIQAKNIVILLHLYHLNLLDEFVTRINKCIRKNSTYNFFIKVNIPVGKNLGSLVPVQGGPALPLTQQDILRLAPYHPHLITEKNGHALHALAHSIEQRFITNSCNVQVIFSENRGVDIGGFFLLLDQTFKQNIPHDYFIKIHSKAHDTWRNKLLKILDLDFNNYIPEFGSIYACKHMSHDGDPTERITRRILSKLLKEFKLPEKKSFPFCAGTMFIASRQLSDFFRKYDLIKLYNKLHMGYTRTIIEEHAYERLFGYLVTHYKLKAYFCNSYRSRTKFLISPGKR